mgnify:CR=1 FL=1
MGGGVPEEPEISTCTATPWTAGLETCPICAEDFDKYWDDNADGGNGDWMVRNAIDPGSGQVSACTYSRFAHYF